MASYKCSKCGRTMDEIQFYTYKDGTKTELCKKCLTMHIDNFDPSTFLWLLEKMDVPYIEGEWNTLRNKAFAKGPDKMNGMSVFGKYLSKMKLRQWKDYHWADTERLKQEEENKLKEKAEANADMAEDAKRRYEAGEISEAEYLTYADTQVQYENYLKKKNEVQKDDPFAVLLANPQPGATVPASRKEAIGIDNAFKEEDYIDESLIDVGADLSEEDKIYLAMKWGRLYKPSEWVELERKYNEMTSSFDIQDSDTIGSLILLCKTYLKMNQALDCGDVDGYQKLSRVYDSLRKTCNFTAAQNKKQAENFADSLGEMVAYCEKEGGKIPRFDISTDNDIIDKIIKDLKDYTRSLVYEDTALARQVEEYLQRRENLDAKKRDEAEAKAKGIEVTVKDEDYEKHLNFLAEARKADEQIQYGEDDAE